MDVVTKKEEGKSVGEKQLIEGFAIELRKGENDNQRTGVFHLIHLIFCIFFKRLSNINFPII